MRMIIAGGGTGGHLFPGVAVAEALAAAGAAHVLFVGSAYGLEATVVPKTRFPFYPVVIQGLRGRGPRGALTFAMQLPVALVQAWRRLGSYRPDLVLGLGGYGSVPVVLAAWLRRVPSVLLEQNVRPGFANRFLAHVARRVCTTFEESAAFFPAGKAVHTGNPVRRLYSAARPQAGDFTVFVFGGSQGARTINHAAVDAAKIVGGRLPGLHIIHQTGAAEAEWVERQYAQMGVAAEVLPFIEDMAAAYGRADLVVSRAGASTLAELTALGKPSILVPYPFAADDHQRANAEVLVRQGAAEMILNAELTGEWLAARILALASDPVRRADMGKAAEQLARPDAALRVIEVCRQIAGERGGYESAV
jgi:UDP-N-acetylglucosamine--N-acetylmuramyl-(pentapeptide) pyrophosphoryl-undecaprenol N-acetylglucosamine transferase